jgi:autotransporter strand-loop-strand O-heptosyltransferase
MNNNNYAQTNIKYYKNWKITIRDENGRDQVIEQDLRDKKVLIRLDSKSLGDTIAWFPYAEEFRKKHNCKVVCSTFHNYFFEKEYPDIKFINPGESESDLYAGYNIGWFSPPWGGPRDRNPNDYRNIPLQKTATDILGLPYKEIAPKITIEDRPRPIKEKYICIAEYSTANAKHWNRKDGWQTLVNYFNSIGYKVMVISEQGTLLRNTIIQTGKLSLMTRINQIKHCEFFVGVGSGLSWIAWAIGKPVVMISGFSKPYCEFTSNCIRIHKDDVCNGCFNSLKYEFDKGELDWCPEWKDTPRMFECTKMISPEFVIEEMKKSGLIS